MSDQSDISRSPVTIPNNIPTDWIWSSLTEVCNPRQWKTISQSDLTKSGYKVFGANGFIGYYSDFNHEKETIAITCRGATCGTLNLVPPKTYITGNAMCLDGIKDTVWEKYLYYIISFRGLSDVISGSAQPQITGESLKFVTFPTPPLREQQKIASIITSVDEVIEKTQSQINKLEDLKKATMNELLTRGIGHTEFKDSELGRIPKSWGVSQNVDLCERIMVGVVITPAKFYVSIGVPVLRSANVKEGFITATDLKFFTNESNELMRKSILKVGDVLTVRTGYPGISAVVDKSFAGGNCVDLLISRPKSMICPDYLAYWINSDFGRGQVLKKQGGLAQQHFNVSELQALIVVLPPKEEQLKIVEILNSIDHQTKNISAKKINFINLKNSLMQDLLTGRVRVTVN